MPTRRSHTAVNNKNKDNYKSKEKNAETEAQNTLNDLINPSACLNLEMMVLVDCPIGRKQEGSNLSNP